MPKQFPHKKPECTIWVSSRQIQLGTEIYCIYIVTISKTNQGVHPNYVNYKELCISPLWLLTQLAYNITPWFRHSIYSIRISTGAVGSLLPSPLVRQLQEANVKYPYPFSSNHDLLLHLVVKLWIIQAVIASLHIPNHLLPSLSHNKASSKYWRI